MELEIRAELRADAARINVVHQRAFGAHHQAARVAGHRHAAAFDPEVSLVATVQGRAAGHALFVPRRLRLAGETVPAVNLVSLAILPELQGRGLGRRLVAAGHAVASAKGYVLSFLVGDPAYYQRFGYRPGAFGSSVVEVARTALPTPTLTPRPVQAADLAGLRELWECEEGAVDFTVDPGTQLRDWVSPNPNIAAWVFVQRRRLRGYVRFHTAHPQRPHVFLAQDAAAARAMGAWLAGMARSGHEGERLALPLHPASASAASLGVPQWSAWGSALARSLGTSPFERYYAEVQAQVRPVGRLLWPVEFEVA